MTDSLNEFCEKIVAELDNEKIVSINPSQKYKELEWWNSMNALIIIAFINVEYGRRFTSEGLRSVETFEDVYNILKS